MEQATKNTYMYNGKELKFVLTRNAKLELEEISEKQAEQFNDPDVLLATSYMDELDNMGDKTKEEQVEIASKVLPVISKMQKLSKSIDSIEVGYILLKNNRNFKEEFSNREVFEELIETMQDEVGIEEMYDFFVGIRDNVFTIIENLQKKETRNQQFQEGVKNLN